jgi:hypothetical membrane protein
MQKGSVSNDPAFSFYRNAFIDDPLCRKNRKNGVIFNTVFVLRD